MPRARKDPASAPDSSPAKARVAALALLGRRDYTSTELTQRLVDKGYAVGDIRNAIEALTADGTVNDARVAAAIVRIASQVKGRGRMRIRQELMARGIDRHLADTALSGHGAGDEAAALARVLARKRQPADGTPEARRKLFQQLMRRGFSPEVIRKGLKGEIDD